MKKREREVETQRVSDSWEFWDAAKATQIKRVQREREREAGSSER